MTESNSDELNAVKFEDAPRVAILPTLMRHPTACCESNCDVLSVAKYESDQPALTQEAADHGEGAGVVSLMGDGLDEDRGL